MRQKTFIIAIFAAILTLTSCGTSRKALESQNLQIQEQLYTLQQEQAARPDKTLREQDPCEKLALEPSEYFRAAGTATAKNVSEAKSAAATDARNQLAQMIRVVVNGESQDYSKNANNGSFTKSESIGEEILSQYVYQSVELTKPIKWSIYDLSNGSVLVYVCMEMTKKPEDFTAELNLRLSQYTPLTNRPIFTQVRVNPEAEALYNEGRENCIKHNHDIGMPQLMQAVEMGSVNAQNYVGLMYLYGDHVEQDSKIAFQYLLSAANNGHKEAVFQVAEMYNSGTGVAKDKVQAKFWYRRAKELGDTRAESRLRRL
ncbi:MAG: tetratricopeptide repeat protein [Rikenellaceae bacterium]